ncbi:MAG: hypothetical protein JJE25_12825 [Bacteroidia bacterium]|nr:hypothetical protein [Bacteroidia bacterium]
MKTKPVLLIALLISINAAFVANAQTLKATIAGMGGKEITSRQLAGDSILAVTEPCYMVTSFRMSAYLKDKKPIEIESNSERLTDQMREAILSLPSGTKVYFEYIKATNVRGAILMAEPLAFTIK